jgi:hypothetical protein
VYVQGTKRYGKARHERTGTQMATGTPTVRTFTIKRLRREYNGSERWVPIGTVVVSTDGTGTAYLNHQDEIWRLYEYVERKKERT